jgi:hypothetical protein
VLCSSQRITYACPGNIIDRMTIERYFIPKLLRMRSEKQDEYTVTNYSEKLVPESVPEKSRFTWEKIEYYVLVAPVQKIEELKMNELLKERLFSLTMENAATI